MCELWISEGILDRFENDSLCSTQRDHLVENELFDEAVLVGWALEVCLGYARQQLADETGRQALFLFLHGDNKTIIIVRSIIPIIPQKTTLCPSTPCKGDDE